MRQGSRKSSWGLCITHKFSKRSHSNPNGILPQSPRVGRHDLPWEQSSKRHFQRRRCCAKHRRFGRNPVGFVSKRGLEPKVGQPLSRKANLGLEGVIPLG